MDAFLAYWLSYFVFSSPPKDDLNIFVFLMVVLLASTHWCWHQWYLGVGAMAFGVGIRVHIGAMFIMIRVHSSYGLIR